MQIQTLEPRRHFAISYSDAAPAIDHGDHEMRVEVPHAARVMAGDDEGSQRVSFGDPGIAVYIRRELGKPSGPITRSDMAQLKVLSLTQGFRDPKVSDLGGLEHAVNLRVLVATRQEISSLEPLSTLRRLWRLDMFSNRVTDLSPLRRIKSLRFISFNRNGGISDLEPLGELRNLTHLYLTENKVTDARPLAKLSALRELSLNENPISDLRPLRSLKELRMLAISYTKVKDLRPLYGLERLTTLDYADNGLREVTSIARMTQLEDIELSYNKITDIKPLTRMPNLRFVMIVRNPLNFSVGTQAHVDLKTLMNNGVRVVRN